MRQPRSTSLVGRGPRDEDTGAFDLCRDRPGQHRKLTTSRDRIARDFFVCRAERLAGPRFHDGLTSASRASHSCDLCGQGQIVKRRCHPSVKSGGRCVSAPENAGVTNDPRKRLLTVGAADSTVGCGDRCDALEARLSLACVRECVGCAYSAV